MSRIIKVFSLICFLFILCSCNTNISSSKNSKSIPIPGSTRMYFNEFFDSTDEVKTYINRILDANANGNFTMGLSEFSVPYDYHLESIYFWGLIEEKSPVDPENDAFGAKYSDFYVRFSYRKNNNIIPVEEYINVLYLPFYDYDGFANKLIQYEIGKSFNNSKVISFFYNGKLIMKVAIKYSSNENVIDDNQMINELINNFYLITK